MYSTTKFARKQGFQLYHPNIKFLPHDTLGPSVDEALQQGRPQVSCYLSRPSEQTLKLINQRKMLPNILCTFRCYCFFYLYWLLIYIPYICHLFYTTTFYGLKILHLKVQKFATKIASQQNNVNF